MEKIKKLKIILPLIIIVVCCILIKSFGVTIDTNGNGWFVSPELPNEPFFCVQSGNPTPGGTIYQKGHTDIHYNKVCHYDNNNNLKAEWYFNDPSKVYEMNGFAILSWVAQGGIDPSNHNVVTRKSERQIAVYANCLAAIRNGAAACGERRN